MKTFLLDINIKAKIYNFKKSKGFCFKQNKYNKKIQVPNVVVCESDRILKTVILYRMKINV